MWQLPYASSHKNYTLFGHTNINCNDKRNDNVNEEGNCKINGHLKP
jgi:hypothetical protein